MRHGSTFLLKDSDGKSILWTVTNPADDTPTALISARPVLDNYGRLGGEEYFNMGILTEALKDELDPPTAS